MAKKYFCTSDIHSFFDIFHKALLKAGFEENNPEHILIVCGDIFDRGDQPLEVYNFLRGLPKERRVLIKGNHEFLLQELVNRGYPSDCDYWNGTYQTLYAIKGLDYEAERRKNHKIVSGIPMSDYISLGPEVSKYRERLKKQQHSIFHNRKLQEILKWIRSDEWTYYYELGPYLFVHAGLPTYYPLGSGTKQKICEYLNSCGEEDWQNAIWFCPYGFYLAHKDEPVLQNKILVAGHWHTSDFWNTLEYKDYDECKFNPIFISDNYPGIIGLDACTAVTHGCNILVINDDMTLEPHNHRDYMIETKTI